MALPNKVLYTLGMRITILESARDHRITGDEIRAVLFTGLVFAITARKPGATLFLFIGPAATNQPWIEVIADFADPTDVEVFHAMMLRRSTVTALGPHLAATIRPDYGRQRA